MAAKILLNSTHIYSLISENKYKIQEKSQFQARCIDGRYKNSSTLAPLSIPGGDIGDLAMLYATATKYMFEVDYDKAFKTFQEVIGTHSLNWHTDEQADSNQLASGCGHMSQIRKDPEAYYIEKSQLEILDAQLQQAEKQQGNQTLLEGEHKEGAVLLVKGQYAVLPEYAIEEDNSRELVQVFVYHQTLVNARHKAWVKLLIQQKVVTLFDDLDEEYLYEVLSNTAEDHLFETAKRLAKTLPIYDVTFDEAGDFKIKDLGFVE